MDNRGSKSYGEAFTSEARPLVNEQQVDGSFCIKRLMHLRCIFTISERNLPIKIPSKQLSVIKFSSSNFSSNPSRLACEAFARRGNIKP